MMDALGDIVVNKILGTLWDWLTTFTLGIIPTWVWVVIAVLAAAWVWKNFGWRGLVGLGLLVLTFGAYRQGWRDAKAGIKPRLDLPVDAKITPKKTPKPALRPQARRRYNPTAGPDGTGGWQRENEAGVWVDE